MPYIHPKLRPNLKLGSAKARTAGELNFKLTSCLVQYWTTHEQNYQTINDMIGALEGAKLEFYRRVVGPYEDVKRAMNGDVYPQK